MKRIALATSMLFAISFGCGEPKAPPPGAPEGKMEKLDVDLTPTEPAPKEDDKAGAPTDTSAEKDSSAGESGEK